MALNECNTTVDEHGRELVEHGSAAFPIACYHDDFRITDVPWHWHEEWEAAVLTQGTCLVAAGNSKVLLKVGDGFFVHSGVLHGCWDEEASGCKFHSLVFHPRLVGGSSDSIFHQHYIQPLLDTTGSEFVILRPEIPWQCQALDSIERAWQHCVQEQEGFPFHVRDALSCLVFLLHKHCDAATASVNAKGLRDSQRIKIMLRCIHSHYDQELNTAAIAASASVSESECLRCFRNTIGTTPIQYLKQYRIRQAARLLTETKQRISDIAISCGFQDMSYFTKSFRQQMGAIPTEYRKNASR